MNLDSWARDTAERVISTFIQSALVFVGAAGALDANWVQALVAACIPPVLVVVMQALPALTYRGPVWWVDAAVRVGRSAAQGFIGALIAAGTNLIDLSSLRAAGIAAAIAALTAAKTVIARARPDTVTPASLATTHTGG